MSAINKPLPKDCQKCKCIPRKFVEELIEKALKPSNLKLAGAQTALSENTEVQPTTFIPMPTIVTENNADMTVAANVGQITVNIAGAYYISWIVQSDNNSSVSLTINGNSSIKSESGTSLLELKEGDVIGLMNLGIDTLNVTFAQLTVWGLA